MDRVERGTKFPEELSGLTSNLQSRFGPQDFGLQRWKSESPKSTRSAHIVGDILVYDTNTICVLMHSHGRTD